MVEKLDGDTDGEAAHEGAETIRVRCAANSVQHDLEVDWTKGAIFEFTSRAEVDHWLEAQNVMVPGRLFLSQVPHEADTLPIDYYLKYSTATH